MMRRYRRSAVTVMRLAAVVLAAIAAGSAQAQTVYPERVIKMIVPSPAGGQTDVMARLMAQKMQQSLGQSVIIENRAGAGGALGARTAAAAEPDGYTLFYGNTSTLAVIPAVSKNAGYDPVKNYAPVASVSESYMILVVHPSFPARTIQEFLAYAKANPGKLNYAHAGAGNVTHLTGEMFRTLAGIDFVNVPHKGGNESVQGVLGNQVDFALESPVILLPLIKEGKLQGARGHEREAAGGDRRCSDHGRERNQRFRCDAADRRRGAGRHPGADRRQAQQRDQRDLEVARHEGPGRAVRLRGAHRLAAGIRHVPGGRDAKMGQYCKAGGRGAGLTHGRDRRGKQRRSTR